MYPPMANPNLEITATEFERLVRDWILMQSGELTSLEVTHDVKVEAHDSTYQIDVLAKFQAFAGAEFTVLIECKKYHRAVERELVQVLHDKVRSVGAHKGMLFATSGFQSGAIKYATAHGIALVSIIDGAATYETRSAFPIAAKPPAWLTLPKYALWHVGENDAGNISMRSLGRTDTEITEMLGH
ncbi:restriction endonuclease [Pseudomonas sp. SG20052]|uniref:restriction endonuclease n=1 Tax=Pseudomonas sp. SG20052 TaxID=3074147 RepID=UPI00287F45D8|nr:restriction endonuclease [Pseudomonas sp. SG20052]WNF58527.1 restriction endonuclease [Pseudomonas sp. SG20052]